jgi:Kdo2-lipid IVA lauroyltransferase/acyltransferase
MIKKGLFWLSTSFLYLISLLPFSLLYILSDILFVVLYYIILYRRKVVQENLANAFPEKSWKERAQIERKYYRFLSDLIIESVKMLSVTEKYLMKHFRFNNIEDITKHFKAGRSVVAVTGHYGNWEWGSIITSLMFPEPVLVVYKPLANKNFNKLINDTRSRYGTVMVSMKNTLRKVVEFIKNGKKYVLVLVGDQTPPSEETQYFTTFLNQPTAVFLGIEKIAKLNNNPIVYFTISPYKRGYYECNIKGLIDNPKETSEYEITEAHTRELESVIRARPEFWLWSHRRWKFKPEDINR